MQEDPRAHAIISAAMDVHSIIGPKHLEAAYQNAWRLNLD